MRPTELASQLGISPKSLRAWLRATFPRTSDEHGSEWVLTQEQVEAATDYWRPRDSSKSAALRSRRHGWVEDEVILALELYVREGVGASPDSVNRLSSILRGLPIEKELAKDEAFRSPSSVKFKLGNLDSIASGGASGFANASMLDREIWFAYADEREQLEIDAISILENIEEAGEVGQLELEEEPPIEGRIVAAVHKRRERDSRLRRRKIQAAETLACEACGFDFEDSYGERGAGFVECHHLVPLAELGASGRRTSLDDLALLCANCHRMIHRERPWLTLPELRASINRRI